MTAAIGNVSVPLNLDAFVLCEDSCNGDSRIAPITQPNYLGLRLDSYLMQHDLLEHVDFHNSKPASANPRLSDIGSSPPAFRNNRLGVHVHWTLPRYYRSGSAQNPPAQSQPQQPGSPDPAQPVFPKVPNRWILIRHLKSSTPAVSSAQIPPLQSWLIESNRWRKTIINPKDQADFDVEVNVDLETDVSPFVVYNTGSQLANTPDALSTQAEVFIGKKTLLQNATIGSAEEYIDLTVMNSSNPLFPDYALHNCNVFSTIDDFSYKASPIDKDEQYLERADVDYYVLGWHADATDDPLSNDDKINLADRLSKMMLKPKDSSNASVNQKSTEATRVLFHGAIYGISYDRKKKPHCLADDFAAKFAPSFSMEPLSVGSTAIDAVLTFLEAHKAQTKVEFGTDLSELTNDILSLSQLLYSANDSYNARMKAADLLLQTNFKPTTGGTRWAFASPANDQKASTAPTEKTNQNLAQPQSGDVTNLRLLNEFQTRLDSLQRMLESSQWDLFAEWWKFVSDQENATSQPKKAAYAEESLRLRDEVKQIQNEISSLQDQINTTKSKVSCKSAPTLPYFCRTDPTLCVAGIDSGWPIDYLDTLSVRIDDDLLTDSQVSSLTDTSQPLKDYLSVLQNATCLDSQLQQSARRLVAEAFSHQMTDDDTKTTGFKSWLKWTPSSPLSTGNDTAGETPPQPSPLGQNPFVPLFIEYELIYYHVDFQDWNVRVRSSPVGHDYKQVRYGIPTKLRTMAKYEDPKNFRTASGRVFILPQPVFSLETLINAVMDTAGNLPINSVEKSFVNEHVKALKFISIPLDGLTNHLLTRADGAHVTPTVRGAGQTPVALEAAIRAALGTGGIKDALARADAEDILKCIGSQSGLTPYGNLFNFGSDYPDVPFKGVTSGQVAFTKINIVDKFGQAICLPNPMPRTNPNLPTSAPSVPTPMPIYPCISDYMCPEIMDDNKPNTILEEAAVQEGQWPVCRFMQLTPSINQAARLNAKFVLPPNGTDYTTWHEATDFEQPIFAWIVVNYADSGLQFFLPDGTFYREVRIGGVAGTNTSAKWLPFDHPIPAAGNAATKASQLDLLIQQLTDPSDAQGTYLQGFFDMINGSIINMPYPPSEYSAYANAIVGKPLALVNVGFSLELAAPAIKAQNTLGKKPADEETELESYQFHYKIGDLDRPFDGVVGYYNAIARDNPDDGTYGTTDFRELFSYFVPTPQITAQRKITLIDPSKFPYLQPYYLKPLSVNDMPTAHWDKMQVKTLIVDPYTPLHAYSPMLPITSLQLPAWTIQSALKRMTAFFRVGPALLSQDVPAVYNDHAPLEADTWLQTQSNAAKASAAQADHTTDDIRLPISGGRGLWNWLQPYEQDDPQKVDPRYNSLSVGQEDTRLRHDPAPYTFIEGYLQLARPLIKEDIGV